MNFWDWSCNDIIQSEIRQFTEEDDYIDPNLYWLILSFLDIKKPKNINKLNLNCGGSIDFMFIDKMSFDSLILEDKRKQLNEHSIIEKQATVLLLEEAFDLYYLYETHKQKPPICRDCWKALNLCRCCLFNFCDWYTMYEFNLLGDEHNDT